MIDDLIQFLGTRLPLRTAKPIGARGCAGDIA
jgi:hypothetical protein